MAQKKRCRLLVRRSDNAVGHLFHHFACRRLNTTSSPTLQPFSNHITMHRSQYDSDITTWSPQGRIHQIEYAMEAVKQGSAAIGLKSKTHAIVVALKRASSELGSHQKKIS